MSQITRVFDIFDRQLAQNPLADCLNHKVKGKWVSFSTQEVAAKINAVSLGLLKLGIQKNDKVAIISANRPEWNFVDLGIQQIGAISVPMYPTITAEDFKYIFEHGEVKIVFVENAELFQKASTATASNPLPIYTFSEVAGAKHWTEVENLGKGEDVAQLKPLKDAVKPQDLLTLIYTSGTTGKPKGVMLSHNNIVSNVLGVRDLFPIKEKTGGKVLSFLPICHIFERTGVYVYFYCFASVYYAESMETIGENIKEVKPDVFLAVPRLLEKVYDKIIAKGFELTGIKKKLFFWAVDLGKVYDPNKSGGFFYDLQLSLANKLIFSKWREALGGNVKAIIIGSAALQPRLARVFWAAGIKVGEGYGLTETSPVIAANHCEVGRIHIGTVGEVIEGCEVKIAEDGEILCKGSNVMMGYYKQPDLTAEVIKNGWFHTGDIGEMVEGKYLKITDRKKEMFKTSGGKYIAPQVMENKFKESVFIEQLMVIGENQKFPAALIIPSFDHLRKWCSMHDIPYSTDKDMIRNEKVLHKIQEEIERLNEGFGNWEKIKQFKLLPQLFSIDGGELTPKLSLKRKAIMAKYEKEVLEIYGSSI